MDGEGFRLRLKEFEPEIGLIFGFHLGLRRESALPYLQLTLARSPDRPGFGLAD
jgi:hypothetical protein